MLTTRIRPKIRVKPLATTKYSAASVVAVERDDGEAARILDRLDEQPAGDEGHDDREHDALRAPPPARVDDAGLGLGDRAAGPLSEHRVVVRMGFAGVLLCGSRHALTAIESSCKGSCQVMPGFASEPRR